MLGYSTCVLSVRCDTTHVVTVYVFLVTFDLPRSKYCSTTTDSHSPLSTYHELRKATYRYLRVGRTTESNCAILDHNETLYH